MKLHTFLRDLRRAGCVLHRHGKKHDLYLNPANGRKAPVPLHTEIRADESTSPGQSMDDM